MALVTSAVDGGMLRRVTLTASGPDGPFSANVDFNPESQLYLVVSTGMAPRRHAERFTTDLTEILVGRDDCEWFTNTAHPTAIWSRTPDHSFILQGVQPSDVVVSVDDLLKMSRTLVANAVELLRLQPSGCVCARYNLLWDVGVIKVD